MSSSTTLQSIGGTAGSGIRRFSKLDLDIWFMILDLISDKSFLRRLSHVCKHFRQAVSKRLYETLELVATEKPVRRKFPYAFYDDFKDGGPPNHLCQHVVHLHVTAPFQKVLAKRCFHHIRPDYNQIEEAHRVQDRSLKWSDLNLFPLIAQIPKNQLRSLRSVYFTFYNHNCTDVQLDWTLEHVCLGGSSIGNPQSMSDRII